MASSDEAVALLRSIDASLRQLVKQHAVVEVADDRDLDGKYGDPIVKFNPRDWTGDSFKGRAFSECPPAFLDLIADTFDYFARKAEETNEQYNGKPVAPYKRKDAARARGWAKRLRSGYAQAAPAGIAQAPDFPQPDWPAEDLPVDDIPF